MSGSGSGSEKRVNIQESMIKKGGSNPKPSTPKPENIVPPSQKPKGSSGPEKK